MILPFRILSACGKQNVNPVFSYVTDNCFIGRHLDSMLQKKNLKTERATWETFHHYSSSAVEYIGLECHLLRLLRIMKWYYVYVGYYKMVPEVVFF